MLKRMGFGVALALLAAPFLTAPPVSFGLGPQRLVASTVVRGIYRFSTTNWTALAADGFNYASDGGTQSANYVGQKAGGLTGMVWLDAYSNSTCQQTMSDAAITAVVNTNVVGLNPGARYQVGDEPTTNGCNAAPTYTHITSIIHAADPAAKTWVADDQFNDPSISHWPAGLPMKGSVDILAFDIYPCVSYPTLHSCHYDMIDSAVTRIHSVSLTNWEFIVQDFGPCFSWVAPTSGELTTQFQHWQNAGAQGYWVYTYDTDPNPCPGNVAGGDAALKTLNALDPNPVPPPPAPSGVLTPLNPVRVLDTRIGLGLTRLSSGLRVALPVLGVGGVPLTGVSAVVINVTTDNATDVGFVAVFPGGMEWPGNSNLNYGPGQPATNLVEATIGSNGKIGFANGGPGGIDLIGDVMGWISSTPAGGAGRLRPLSPSRILDTRTSSSLAGGLAGLTLTVTGKGGVPGTGVSAVVLNVTVTNPAAGGFLAAFPAGTTWPGNSNLNFAAGQTIPNRVIVKVSGGAVTFVTSAPTTDVIVDVGGWFTDGSNPSATGGSLTGMLPVRLLDTRTGTGPIGPGGTYKLLVAGVGGTPSSGVSSVVLNVTATDVTAESFIAVFPDGVAWAVTSDLNTAPGRTSTNLVIVKLGLNGIVDLVNASGSVALIADLVGWYD